MRGWWQDLTDLVLPAECGGCGRPRTVLCPECRAALSGAAPSRVRPVPEPPGLPVVHAAARYADEVRAALLAHKERGALALATPLGAALAGAVRAGLGEIGGCGWGEGDGGVRAGIGGVGPAAELGMAGTSAEPRGSGASAGFGGPGGAAGPGVPTMSVGLTGGSVGCGCGPGGVVPDARRPVLLVPVPSARGAVRARGHDPARRIALAAAGELRRGGVPARVLAVLRQRRAVADQSGLNSRQRLENLAGALAVAPGGERLLRGGRIVLVDDLMTTGASLTEAARAVRAAMADASEGEVEREVGDGGRGMSGERGSAGSWGVGPVSCGGGTTAVYPAVAREGMGEPVAGPPAQGAGCRRAGSGKAGAGGARDVICAAVVAASPDSFEINRN
ncbi:ComF family protein [Streptomyces sp. NPDC047081]|uniref:ComF family protein n=1 Tax=Streptomyces sp. NPDC047081 TaxID=3154706 RepID=UPI003405DA1D